MEIVKRAGRLVGAVASVAALAGGAAVVAPVAPASAKTAVESHPHAPYAVGSRTYTFVDPTRPTSAHGTYPGAPTRTLPTLLLYPAAGDPAGPIVANAAPVRRRGGFPLIVFSHGFGASGPAYQFLLHASCGPATWSPPRRSRRPAAARPAARTGATTSTSPPT